MVQKNESEPRRRGRPRAYDPDEALDQAIKAFWRAGFSGTSLDDIVLATGMNRPSLYAAFGDKRALYLKALERYWSLGFAAMREVLADDRPLAAALMDLYRKALSMYFSQSGPPRGCFAIGTAATEAVEDPMIRAAFAKGLRVLDEAFEARIRTGAERREIPDGADPAALAVVASATLHTLAIRSRAGTPRSALERMAKQAVGVICGPDRAGE